MDTPLTYPVGTGNVIGSHSAQDFVWAGRAEGSQEQATGETATHTPAETNTPYTGPISEPLGTEVQFGAEKGIIRAISKTLGLSDWVITASAIIGGVIIIISSWSAAVASLSDFPLIGGIINKTGAWINNKSTSEKILILGVGLTLTWLGATHGSLKLRYGGATESKGSSS